MEPGWNGNFSLMENIHSHEDLLFNANNCTKWDLSTTGGKNQSFTVVIGRFHCTWIRNEFNI
jgi:hypothetical protein